MMPEHEHYMEMALQLARECAQVREYVFRTLRERG